MLSETIVNRLLNIYFKHGLIIIAYDFDDTVSPYRTTDSFEMVHELIRALKPYAKFLVFTASNESRFPYIEEYLRAHNLPYDSINGDLVDLGWKSRKPYYNILLDDRSGLLQVYNELQEFLKIVSGKDTNKLNK